MTKKRILPDDRLAECKAAHDLFLAKKNELKLSQRKIADAAGVTPAAVNLYFKGINPLNSQFAAVLSNLLQEPVESFSPRLAGEIAKMTRAVTAPEKTSNSLGAPSEEDYALIPQFSAKGACGDGYLNEHVQLTEGLVFKRDWLKRMNAKPENLFVIYADGDSMEPYIFEGDVVLFDTSQTEPRDKQVYVIRRPDGGNSIKRLIQQLSGAWVIRSDSSDKVENPDEPVSETSIHGMPILGRVIWRGGGVG